MITADFLTNRPGVAAAVFGERQMIREVIARELEIDFPNDIDFKCGNFGKLHDPGRLSWTMMITASHTQVRENRAEDIIAAVLGIVYPFSGETLGAVHLNLGWILTGYQIGTYREIESHCPNGS